MQSSAFEESEKQKNLVLGKATHDFLYPSLSCHRQPIEYFLINLDNF